MVASLGSPLGKVIENGEIKIVFNPENPLASENNKEDPKLGSIQLPRLFRRGALGLLRAQHGAAHARRTGARPRARPVGP